MPLPNEHAARQTDPGSYARFARQHPKGWPAGVDAVFGVTEDGDAELQSIRFDKEQFTPAEAKAWLEEHDMKAGGFEEASEGKEKQVRSVVVRAAVPAHDTPEGERPWDQWPADQRLRNWAGVRVENEDE